MGAVRETLARYRLKLVLLGLALVAALEHVRLARLVATATNGDVTQFWYTAREWGAFHPRQPNVYGQTFGGNIEALPMELLRRLGAPPWSATTLVWAMFAVLGWLLLAVAAWRSSHRVLAVLAMAAPALLAAYYSFVIASVPEFQGTHFLVVAGVAILLTSPRHAGVEAGGWTLLGLGVLMEHGGVLLGGPVAIWYLLSRGLTRKRLSAVAVGALVPAAYQLWFWSFYRAHPDYTIFGSTSIRPSWSILVDSLKHLDRFFALFILELAPYWQLAAGVTLGLALVLIATREAKYVLPAAIVPVLLVWGMATPLAQKEFGPFLSSARLFVTLPYVLWFLAYLVAESGVLHRLWRSQRVRPKRLASVAVAGLTAFALISVGVRQVAYEDRVGGLLAEARVATYGFPTRTRALVATCAQLRAAARSVRASIIVFPDAVGAYGCGAIDYGRITTLVAGRIPDIERRTWLLYGELQRTRSAAVLAGVHPGYCDFAAPRVARCRPAGPHAVTLTFPPQTLLGLLMVLGVPVRSFGPDCIPKIRFTCSNPLLPSIDDLKTGAPPGDEAAARREIERAFAMASDLDSDFATLEDGSVISAKVGPYRNEYAKAMSAARVSVGRIDFLNARQAAVDLRVPTFGTTTAFRGWAIRRDGSWRVDRNTYCRIELYATYGNRWCSRS